MPDNNNKKVEDALQTLRLYDHHSPEYLEAMQTMSASLRGDSVPIKNRLLLLEFVEHYETYVPSNDPELKQGLLGWLQRSRSFPHDYFWGFQLFPRVGLITLTIFLIHVCIFKTLEESFLLSIPVAIGLTRYFYQQLMAEQTLSRSGFNVFCTPPCSSDRLWYNL